MPVPITRSHRVKQIILQAAEDVKTVPCRMALLVAATQAKVVNKGFVAVTTGRIAILQPAQRQITVIHAKRVESLPRPVMALPWEMVVLGLTVRVKKQVPTHRVLRPVAVSQRNFVCPMRMIG